MPLFPVNIVARTTRDSTTNAKLKWTNGMIVDLLLSLGQFKSNMEYRNVERFLQGNGKDKGIATFQY